MQHRITQQRPLPGLRIHLHLGDVTPVRKRRPRRFPEPRPVQHIRHRPLTEPPRHRLQPHRPVGPDNAKHPIRERDIRRRRLQRIRRQRQRLLHQIHRRIRQRRPGNRDRRRPPRPMPRRDPIRIPLHHVDIVGIEPQLIRHQLRIRRLMPLAVRHRAHQHRHPPIRPQLEPGMLRPTPRHPLAIMRPPQPTQFANRRRPRPPIGEPRHIRPLQRRLQHLRKIAAVVAQPKPGLIRHFMRMQNVLPPQLQLVHPQRAGRMIHQPLQQIHRLRPPRAAIHLRRRRVRKHARHLRQDRRQPIHPRQRRHVRRRRQLPLRRQIRPHRRRRRHMQRHEPILGIQRQRPLIHIVPRLVVRHEPVRPLPHPGHRSPDTPRRPQHNHLLRIQRVLDPETPPHIGRQHPNLIRRHLEHIPRQRLLQPMRHLRPRRQHIPPALERPDRAARLQGADMHPRILRPQPHHMRRLGERRLHRRPIPGRPAETHIVRRLVPHRRRPRHRRRRRPRHRRQRVILNHHQLSRIPRHPLALRHHHRHRIADKPRPLPRYGRMLRPKHKPCPLRCPRKPDQIAPRRNPPQPIRRIILPRQHRQHPRHRQRRRHINPHNPRMRVRAADHHRPRHVSRDHVLREPPPACEQSGILLATKRLAECVAAHGNSFTSPAVCDGTPPEGQSTCERASVRGKEGKAPPAQGHRAAYVAFGHGPLDP